MRYAQGGGLTAAQRAKRKQVRLRAAELFACGYTDEQVAKKLRVPPGGGQPMAPSLDPRRRRDAGLQRPGVAAAGDKVLAADPETGKTEAKPVVDLIVGEGVKNLVQITVNTDETKGTKTGVVIATDEHPFWLTNLREWVPATRLTAEAWLRISTGTYVQITAITKRTVNNQRGHNLTITGTHTYHVAVGEVDVLVHDADCWSTTYENASDLANLGLSR